MVNQITLLLGGARSGKSALACSLASQSAKQPIIYIATALAADQEMAERIRRHQQDRPAHWRVVEAPLALAEAIVQHNQPDSCLIIDCLTLWLSNLLHDAEGTPNPLAKIEPQIAAFEQALINAKGRILIVSNEVGLGIIPLGELTRRFVDEAGRLNQRLARLADRVLFVAAGLPLVLKESPEHTSYD